MGIVDSLYINNKGSCLIWNFECSGILSGFVGNVFFLEFYLCVVVDLFFICNLDVLSCLVDIKIDLCFGVNLFMFNFFLKFRYFFE